MPNALVGAITFHLGNLSTQGRLLQIADDPDREVRSKLCTPEGEAVQQFYLTEDGSRYTVSQLARMLPDGRVVSAQALREARRSTLPDNDLYFTIHDISEVDGAMAPARSGAYIFEPGRRRTARGAFEHDNANWEMHASLIALATERKALLAFGSVKGTEGVYRLTTFDGRLVLQRQTFPEDVLEYSFTYQAIPDRQHDRLFSMLDRATEPFDPSAYRQRALARIASMPTIDESVVIDNDVIDEVSWDDVDALLDAWGGDSVGDESQP